MNTFHSSTPIMQYTPPHKSNKSHGERSTVQKFYDLESSFKQYEQLLQENLKLRHQLLDNQVPTQCSLQQSRNRNGSLYFEEKYGTQNSGHKTTYKIHSIPLQIVSPLQNNQNCNTDMSLWAVKERNNFLEYKVDGLRRQYQKQSSEIRNIRDSEKWKNRFDCTQRSCYQQKYLQLLRVRSPVLLD